MPVERTRPLCARAKTRFTSFRASRQAAMFEQYYPIFLVFLIVIVIVSVIMVLTTFVGPKKRTRAKYDVFECGSETIGSARERFSVKWYMVAIGFILFDLETVFLYPWAVLYKDFAAAGMAAYMFVAMLVFVTIVTIGLVYEWRSGGLDWD